MKSQSATYQRGKGKDWSVEITPSEARSASDTGLGGVERDASDMDHANAGRDMSNRNHNGAGGMSDMNRNGAGSMSNTGFVGGANTGFSNGADWIYNPMTDVSPDALSVSDANSGANPPRDAAWPDIENNMPDDEIEAPTTMDEVYRGSMKALLLRNVGNYVVATFLIGTQTTVSWEGILYDVGNDYLAIYQSGRDQYIVSDLYSLKYVEFYDTRRRALCDSLLTEQNPSGNAQR